MGAFRRDAIRPAGARFISFEPSPLLGVVSKGLCSHPRGTFQTQQEALQVNTCSAAQELAAGTGLTSQKDSGQCASGSSS